MRDVSASESADPRKAVLDELQRVLASPAFYRARQLWPVLRAIVEQSLDRGTPLISEKSLGRTVLGEAFDPTSDSTIRVRVREIRNKLTQYYTGSGAADPIEIRIPAGGYRARFAPRKAGPVKLIPVEKDGSLHQARVGVLPFRVLAGGIPPDFGYNAAFFLAQVLGSARGIAVHSLPVLPHPSEPGTNLRDVCSSYKLGLVVQGVVCMMDGSLRIVVSTTDAVAETVAWSETFACDTADFGFVLRIARELARRLARVESSDFSGRIIPSNPRAADFFCKGVRAWSERTPESIARAEEYLSQSASADPMHAATYAALANCSLFRVILGQRPNDVLPAAIERAARAVGCDPDSAAAHAALGGIKSILQHDWTGAEAEFEVCQNLNPDSMDYLGWYSGHLAATGRPEAAIQAARRLEVLDPHSFFVTAHVAKIFLFCGDYDAAISRLEPVCAVAPQIDLAWGLLGTARCASRDFRRGLSDLHRAAELTRGAPVHIAALGHFSALSGDREASLAIAEELECRSRAGYVPPALIAAVHAGLGQTDWAFSCLESAYRENDFYLAIAKVWPLLAPLHADPRFPALLARMGLH